MQISLGEEVELYSLFCIHDSIVSEYIFIMLVIQTAHALTRDFDNTYPEGLFSNHSRKGENQAKVFEKNSNLLPITRI